MASDSSARRASSHQPPPPPPSPSPSSPSPSTHVARHTVNRSRPASAKDTRHAPGTHTGTPDGINATTPSLASAATGHAGATSSPSNLRRRHSSAQELENNIRSSVFHSNVGRTDSSIMPPSKRVTSSTSNELQSTNQSAFSGAIATTTTSNDGAAYQRSHSQQQAVGIPHHGNMAVGVSWERLTDYPVASTSVGRAAAKTGSGSGLRRSLPSASASNSRYRISQELEVMNLAVTGLDLTQAPLTGTPLGGSMLAQQQPSPPSTVRTSTPPNKNNVSVAMATEPTPGQGEVHSRLWVRKACHSSPLIVSLQVEEKEPIVNREVLPWQLWMPRPLQGTMTSLPTLHPPVHPATTHTLLHRPLCCQPPIRFKPHPPPPIMWLP